MSTHEERQEDCAAYVLGALDEHEVASMRAHLEECPLCRAEVTRLEDVAGVLARGVPPVSAPAELRRRVLDAVEGNAALFEAASRPERRSAPRWRMRLRPMPALAGGGIALALGIVLGALVIAPGGTPAARVVSAQVAPAGRWGSAHAPVAELRESGGSAELVMTGLPAAPAGRIYEVWVERAGRPRPTDALFNASSGGRATVAVPQDLHGASAVLVTAERLGGARVPTMKPLITAALG